MYILPIGLLIPFAGTALGAACVFVMKKELGAMVRRSLAGFAGGVMVAASIWSLIIPAMQQSEGMGRLSFFPAAAGFWCGVLFLLALDSLIPHIHVNAEKAEGVRSRLKRATMLVLAVTLHNIPEGMTIGVVFAGLMANNSAITVGGALALALGIAIQNFPEGAIVSMPLLAEGKTKRRAFFYGLMSGIVEPVGALLTIFAAGFVLPAMPYFLSFAAGAMVYVVVDELIPQMSEGEHSNIGVLMFTAGFTLMMILDVALS
ncbi:MAG: ZIP family metal transporter [Lachnospiraceae bacterium]|nr:ZIP family metal transporter [Lachnospiraceae bacterium]